jgi:hypothetical protein
MDPTGSSVGAAPGTVTVTCGAGVLAAGVPAWGVLVADLLGDAAGALTVTVSDAAGSVAMAGLVVASAVAVSVTDVTEVALEATGICACIWNDEGDTEVASDPSVQVADPFPLGHRPLNVAVSPCGAALSVTDTADAGPLAADTCTMYDAA